MAIADSTVIIAFAKIGRLVLLKRVFRRITISPVVKDEVVDNGLKVLAPEVRYVQQALAERWLRVTRLTDTEKKLKERLVSATTLDLGEAESIAVAKLRGITLLVDEKEARTIARGMGVEPVGSAGILLEAFKLGYLRLDELEEAVIDLARVIWLSPDIVVDIIKRAREVKR